MISNKFSNIESSIGIEISENGYVLAVTGRNFKDEYIDVKYLCVDLEVLIDLLKEATKVCKND